MRCAAFVATDHGLTLAAKLAEQLGEPVDIYVKDGREAPFAVRRYARLGDAVKELFPSYDALIFFMAVGIVVRMIAPCLKSKLTDPAVVAIDEQGNYAISLLSGHVGGANRLTHRVAEIFGAVPVITTATDVNHFSAPDQIASEVGLKPVPKPEIQTINSALLSGQEIAWYIDPSLKRLEFYRDALAARGIPVQQRQREDMLAQEGLAVFVTESPPARPGLLNLVPRRLAAGIGCRRGVPKEAIKAALTEACRRIGHDVGAVSVLASTVVKQDEQGLLALAEDLGVAAKFYENEALQEKITAYHLTESSFVKGNIGVGNICEAAALCAVGEGRVALEKTKFTKVTVALVWEK